MKRFLPALLPVVIGLLLATSAAFAQKATPLTPKELVNRTVHRRAVDAAIWGIPILNFDAMRQAYFRDAKAKYNDIIWWPKGSGEQRTSRSPSTRVFATCTSSATHGKTVLSLWTCHQPFKEPVFTAPSRTPGSCRSLTSASRERAAST